jgi:glutathione-regulated potassium-efflux system ancillary protein KefG
MAGMKRILVLFAHPALRRSRVNRRLLEDVRGVEGGFVNDLYEQYPELYIDVEREQALLLEHDVIVFQHPFYWYSTPAILKEWQDLVLEHGWAYGRDGHALDGKLLMSAITTGGGVESYCRDGSNRYGVRELLAPIEQTARLCGMDFLPPFVVHGTHRLADDEIARHAAAYRRTLEALRDERLDLELARSRSQINEDLAAVVRD